MLARLATQFKAKLKALTAWSSTFVPLFAFAAVVAIVNFLGDVVHRNGGGHPSNAIQLVWVIQLSLVPASLAALVAGTLVLNSVVLRRPFVGQIVVAQSVAFAALIVLSPRVGSEVKLSDSTKAIFAEPSSAAERVVVGVVLLYLIAKMAALVHRNDRLTTNYDGITTKAAAVVDGELLTKRQQSSLQYLVESLEADRPASHHASIALTGGWGSGKSRVAYALQELCDPRTSQRRRDNLIGIPGNARPNLMVAIVDVWGVARAQDVSFEIVETALRQPGARARGLWLMHPLPLNRRLILSRIRLRYKTVKADLKFNPIPPSITRLKHVERLARSLSRRQVRLVVVLDELDRAGTVVAQAAVSSARRGLDVRAVTTVLVCDTRIMAQKLANPLTPALLDIDSARTAFYIQENAADFAQRYIALQGHEEDRTLRAVRATYLQLPSAVRVGQETSFLLRYLGGRMLEINSFGGEAVDITDAAHVFPQIWRAINKVLGGELDLVSLTSSVKTVLTSFDSPFVSYRTFERNVSSKLIKHIYGDGFSGRPTSDGLHKAVATVLTVAAISEF